MDATTDDTNCGFTPDQRRALLNLLDDAPALQTFDASDKADLELLLEHAKAITALIEARAFWAKVRGKLKWFLVQCAALLTAAEAINALWELVLKWRNLA